MPLAPTATLAQNQERAKRQAKATQDAENHGATTLVVGDEGPEVTHVIYIYNLIDREHTIHMPPQFPAMKIPACKEGMKFSVTTIPAFIKERYEKPGTTEYSYRRVDGRKYATSLLNPSAYPSTDWYAQLQNWETTDQFGNNLNAFGVFWSLTKPDAPELEAEIKQFKLRVNKTMNELVRVAEALHTSGQGKDISPLHHFAMDYLKRQAVWHMSHDHMVSCPTCGDPIKDGIVYHRNSMGDRCIVDFEKAKLMGLIKADGQVVPEKPATPAAAVGAGTEASGKTDKKRTRKTAA